MSIQMYATFNFDDHRMRFYLASTLNVLQDVKKSINNLDLNLTRAD